MDRITTLQRESIDLRSPGWASTFWSDAASSTGLLLFKEALTANIESEGASFFEKLANHLGTALHVISRWPLVHQVPVSLDAHENRFGGTGQLGFHVDIVNSSLPPDAIVFICVRPDPGQGGATLLSSMLAAYHSLSKADQLALERAKGIEERFFGFMNVGDRLDPYPIVEREACGVRFRITEKPLPDINSSVENAAIVKFREALAEGAFQVSLEKGDVLVINQRLYAHSRAALGAGQAQIPPDLRRLLLRGFIRRFHDSGQTG